MIRAILVKRKEIWLIHTTSIENETIYNGTLQAIKQYKEIRVIKVDSYTDLLIIIKNLNKD